MWRILQIGGASSFLLSGSSDVTAANAAGHLSSKVKNCSSKADRGNRAELSASKIINEVALLLVSKCAQRLLMGSRTAALLSLFTV